MKLLFVSSVRKLLSSSEAGRAHEKSNNFPNQAEEKRAIADLKSYIRETDPQDLNFEIAEKLIDFGEFVEAKEYLERALTLNPECSERGRIYYLIAQCCYGLDLINEGLQNLEQALSYESNNTEYWSFQADCLLEIGDWEQAVSSLKKAILSSPGDAEIVFRLGSIFFHHKEYAEALNCFSGCCRIKPFNSEYWEMKAEVLIKLNQIKAAAEAFKKAYKYSGRHHILPRLAYCYSVIGQQKKAKKLLLKVLKNDPDDYEALYNLAGIYHKLNNNEEAYKLLKRALVLNNNDPLLYNNLGYIANKLGRSRKAINYYKQALQLKTDDLVILYNLACCLYEKGLWEEAKITLEKLISLDPKNAAAWTLLGNIYDQISRPQKAVDCYNRSLGLA
ncbi:MAG: tetratricopeptide repeat protein [Desulfitobacteriia bacterium]|jgi:tetratricopeptide (TPR) repeat protein